MTGSKTYRLILSHLLQRAVYTLLKDLNLLVLLIAQLLQFVSAVVKLLGLILELNLFSLQMNPPTLSAQSTCGRDEDSTQRTLSESSSS